MKSSSTSTLHWRSADLHTPLGAADVDVWRIDLDDRAAPPITHPAFSDSERERARRYRFATDRDAFLCARFALRDILARTNECRPQDVRFVEAPGEKPMLPAEASCFFSFSRTAGRALCAVTRIAPLGIDVEVERQLDGLEDLARDVLAPQELADLGALPREQRQAAFFRAWTRKEAYLKALGVGLRRDPRSVLVSLGEDEVAAVDDPDTREQRWFLYTFARELRCHAALVIAAPSAEIRCWEWYDSRSPAAVDSDRTD